MKKLTFSMIFVALTVIVFGQTVQNAKTAREAGVVSVSHDVISPKSNSFTEGFEAFVIPGTMNGWTRIQTNANVTWDTTSFDPYTGSRYVGCTYDYVSVTPELQNEWLITPALDLSAATDVTVSFAWRGSKYYSLFPYDDCDLLLKYSIDGGTTWSSPVWNELTDDTTLFVSWTWAVANVNIPGVSGQSNVKFALNYYGTDGSEFDVDDFKESTEGIFILNSSEDVGKAFINEKLHQDLEKRPDLVAKVNTTYIVGEAKWIGSPGGNQNKQVVEVINVCKNQRRNIIRVGIIDGFPWAVRKSDGTIINDKTCVQVQECEYDIISALLLRDYLNSFL